MDVEPSSKLRLGIPKGSLEAATIELFKQAGWTVTPRSRNYFPSINDPEIDHTYTLCYETWKEGKAAIEANTTPSWLPWRCRAQWDFWTNETLPEHLQIRYDYDYTIRAWMATMSYLLSDYRFLYE